MTTETNLPEHLSYLSHLKPEILKAIDGPSQVVQSLERQNLESEMERLNVLETPAYERIGKVLATAMEHEYNVVTARQDKIGYAVYKDGDIPRTVDIEIARRRVTPSFIGQRITYTEIAVAVTKGGVKSIEQVARDEKIVAVMEETEYLIFHGDRRFGSGTDFSTGQNLQFDGLERIVKNGAPQNILDLKGAPLSLAALWAAENKVYQTQGLAKPSTVFISPIDKINLQSSFYQIARTNQAERASGILGNEAQTFISAYGQSELVTSRFLGDWHRYQNGAFGNSSGEYSRPLTPMIVAPGAQGSRLEGVAGGLAGLDEGVAVTYFIKSANFYGESAARSVSLGAPTNGTSKAVLALDNVDSNTKWFIVFRQDGNGKPKFLKRVPYYGSEATVTIEDDGHEALQSAYGNFRYRKLPGTGMVVGLDLMTTSIAQWIPLEQVPLPQALNRDYAIRHVSSLFARAPEFNFLIINVGQESLIA